MLSEQAKAKIVSTTRMFMEEYPDDIPIVMAKGPRKFLDDLITVGLTASDPLAAEMQDNREETERIFAGMLGMM